MCYCPIKFTAWLTDVPLQWTVGRWPGRRSSVYGEASHGILAASMEICSRSCTYLVGSILFGCMAVGDVGNEEDCPAPVLPAVM